jgi:hypothetical protein
MRDVFDYESRVGILGGVANYAYLTRYMTAVIAASQQADQESCGKAGIQA